jgi:hypothetical protein
MVKDSDWKDSLFIIRTESDDTLITFPKNIESFADNLFMISLIKLCVLMQWRIQLSTCELPVSVFDSTEGAFFAGFIAAACLKETGERIKGNTRFSKGASAFQSFSIEKKYGRVVHLHTGGMDSLMQRLSAMKGFTKDYWGLRGSLAAILKMIRPIPVSSLKSYMVSKQEILKSIRTKLPYENGGLFRTEEIACLNIRYTKAREAINEFIALLDNPTDDLAAHLMERFSRVKTLIEKVDGEVKLLAVNRSKILFPVGSKKSIMKYKAKSLEDKLMELDDTKLDKFRPESLPGIGRDTASQSEFGTLKWRKETYSSYLYEATKELIDSWYNTFESSVEEDE